MRSISTAGSGIARKLPGARPFAIAVAARARGGHIPPMRSSLCIAAVTIAAALPLRAQDNPLVAFNAGSLAVPLRAALDSFAAREHATIQQENAGSLETARKLTELHRIPDVVALADHEIFPQLLMPRYVTSYTQFARNRMVIAYGPKSKFASEITAANWTEILLRAGVETGRADPSLDPNGYRTLLTLQLAESFYAKPGLAGRLLQAIPDRNIRPNEVQLVALVQAGELDYIWSYESIAQAAALAYVRLPREIDLGDPASAARYATASVRVAGKTPRDSITFVGAPIVYGVAVPIDAPHKALAERFLAWLLSGEGVRVLRAAKLDALETPVIVRGPSSP
jgi:molybdate/tungstate transport system substrate-binding protein